MTRRDLWPPAVAFQATADWPPRDAAHVLVRPQEMHAVEQAMFAAGMPVAALMEKAALALSRRVLELVQAGDAAMATGDAIVVLVGPGHNGGDGLVLARELHQAGRRVAVWSPFTSYKPLTASHLGYIGKLGVEQLDAPPVPGSGSLWIDAVFGLGQTRPLPEPVGRLARAAAAARQTVWAVDVPSGLHDGSGRLLGACFRCERTFCLGLYKRGLLQPDAVAAVGRLERLDIGIPDWARAAAAPPGRKQPCGISRGDLHQAPRPLPPLNGDKYGRGRLLLMAGSRRYPGAAVLTAAGADASGAGVVATWMQPAVSAKVHGMHPHFLDATAGEAGPCGTGPLAWEALPSLLRFDAVVLGPGIDRLPFNGAAWQPLQAFPGLLVLDADGLNRLADHPDGGPVAWLGGRNGPTWITPHEREFARLFPQLSAGDTIDRAGEAAACCGVTVLLKGPRTVVASPDGRTWQLLEASAEAARAGFGDLLTGYAGGCGAVAAAAGCLDCRDLAMAALAHGAAGCALVDEGWRGPSALAVQERLGRYPR